MKHIFSTVILVFVTIVCCAQEGAGRYNISLMGVYGWNETWRNYGGLDIKGYLPVNKHFEATAAFEVHNPKTYAVTAIARPKFHLPVGEIFVDGAVHYRKHGSYGVSDFNLAASAGFRMDYITAQIGATSHFILNLNRQESFNSENITEPLNLLYRFVINARPNSSRWNVGAGIANFTYYEYERTWVPRYFLDGYFGVNDSFSFLCNIELKPTGVFHQTTEFWGVAVRAGGKYIF